MQCVSWTARISVHVRDGLIIVPQHHRDALLVLQELMMPSGISQRKVQDSLRMFIKGD